jgi:mono/diheme cytochrome c family protein
MDGSGILGLMKILLGPLFLLLGMLGSAAETKSLSPRPYVSKPKGTVTFNADIAPIIFQNCASCHRTGEVAPFPLLSYEDVKKKAKTIARVVDERYMPPWHAEPGYGEFLDERRLTDEQIGMIGQWVEEGMAQGIGAPPPLPKFVEGWQLGKPDLVVKMSAPFMVPAEGRDVFRCFVVPLNLPADKNVSAVEYRPSNRRVVHHALLFLDTTGAARKLDDEDPEPGYSRFGGIGFRASGGLGGWVPGATVHPMPDGFVHVVKKSSDLVIQTHFHPSGKVEPEQSEVGIYFSKKPAQKLSLSFPLFGFPLNIPPGEKHYVVKGSITVPADADLFGITPHSHLLAKEMKVTATLPDGKTIPLIWIKNWDFNWQGQYQYKKPIFIPKGTRIDMMHVFDNSADNPANPNNPPRRVTFGEQTTDEMAICFLQFVADNPQLNAWLLDRAKNGQPINGRRTGRQQKETK